MDQSTGALAESSTKTALDGKKFADSPLPQNPSSADVISSSKMDLLRPMAGLPRDQTFRNDEKLKAPTKTNEHWSIPASKMTDEDLSMTSLEATVMKAQTECKPLFQFIASSNNLSTGGKHRRSVDLTPNKAERSPFTRVPANANRTPSSRGSTKFDNVSTRLDTFLGEAEGSTAHLQISRASSLADEGDA